MPDKCAQRREVVYFELRNYLADIGFDRYQRDAKLRCDPAGRNIVPHERQHFGFARRDPVAVHYPLVEELFGLDLLD